MVVRISLLSLSSFFSLNGWEILTTGITRGIYPDHSIHVVRSKMWTQDTNSHITTTTYCSTIYHTVRLWLKIKWKLEQNTSKIFIGRWFYVQITYRRDKLKAHTRACEEERGRKREREFKVSGSKRKTSDLTAIYRTNSIASHAQQQGFQSWSSVRNIF